MQALAGYWRRIMTGAKSRRADALPNFITEIDGLDIISFTFGRNMKMRCADRDARVARSIVEQLRSSSR